MDTILSLRTMAAAQLLEAQGSLGELEQEEMTTTVGKPLKPMLGATIERTELEALLAKNYLLASYKLDGIRALVRGGVVLSRSLKPIPNAHVQKMFGLPQYEGFDGELIVGAANAPDVFRNTTSGVMSEDGYPSVTFHVFDLWNQPNAPLHQRYAEIQRRVAQAQSVTGCIVMVVQHRVKDMADVDKLFAWALATGFEGLVLRNPFGLYKFGRSTVKEAGLLKVKPFVDAEAEVVGVVEQMHNGNEAFTNAVGRTERSTAKAGKSGMGVLGALICRTPEGVVFQIGTGFSLLERAHLWLHQNKLCIGRTVKYKSLAIGVKDAPRHAVFLGWRDKRDM